MILSPVSLTNILSLLAYVHHLLRVMPYLHQLYRTNKGAGLVIHLQEPLEKRRL
jgi:hypothetical protein